MVSDKQLAWAKTLYNEFEINNADGAVRCGKTWVGAEFIFPEYIDKCCRSYIDNEKDTSFAIVAQTKLNAYQNVGVYVTKALRKKGHEIKMSNLDMIITDKCTIRLYGVNNKNSWVNIKGETFHGAFIDEGALLSKVAINTVIDRTLTYSKGIDLKGKPFRKIWITSNCEGGAKHWFKVNFVDVYNTINFQMIDNPLFNQSHIDNYKKVMPDYKYRRDALGEWVVGSGAVYPVLPKVISAEELTGDYDVIYYGIDYGENDAVSCIPVGINYITNKYQVLGQYYHKNDDQSERKTIVDYEREIVNFINDTHSRFQGKKYTHINCEYSPSSLYNLMNVNNELNKEIGLSKVNKKKRNRKSTSAIEERITATQLLINMGLLEIVEDATHLISAFENAETDKHGKRLDDGTSDIDSLDSWEYSIVDEILEIFEIFNQKEMGGNL